MLTQGGSDLIASLVFSQLDVQVSACFSVVRLYVNTTEDLREYGVCTFSFVMFRAAEVADSDASLNGDLTGG